MMTRQESIELTRRVLPHFEHDTPEITDHVRDEPREVFAECAANPRPELLDVELQQVRLKALAWGPPGGRLVLCLHGFPDSAWSWRHLGPILAASGLRVVAPFMRGYAPSELPADGDYHIGALMHDAVELCRALEGGDDAVLVGHDWGSFTSNAVAAYPDSPFSCHISLSVPPVAGLVPRRGALRRHVRLLARQLRMSWYIIFFQLPVLPERILHRIIGRLWRDWSPSHDGSADVANALAALPNRARRAAAIAYYRAMARNTTPSRLYADLHRYRYQLPRGPFLYLHGAEDGALHPGFVEFLDTLGRDATVVMIQSAGHFLQVEQPNAVAEAIYRFLADVGRGPTPSA